MLAGLFSPRAAARAAPVSPPEVLDAEHRLLRGEDFSAAVRTGARRGSRRLVVHYCAGGSGDISPALVGVVVPKKQIALATHRNRVKRRIRALMAARLTELEPGSRVVVRGLAGAEGATSAELGRDIDSLLERCRALHREGRRR